MLYHVWFPTKYRKMTLVGSVEIFAKNILSECAQRHNYKILELETNKDHVHILVESADRKELSATIRTLKAVSARELQRTPCFRMGNSRSNEGFHTRKCVEERKHFWARKYGCKEIGKSEIDSIRQYIRNQK